MKNEIQSTNLKPKKSHVRPRIFAYAAVGVIAAVLMVGGARWYGENQAKKNADKEGKLIIIVTHINDDILNKCDEVLQISEGKIL